VQRKSGKSPFSQWEDGYFSCRKKIFSVCRDAYSFGTLFPVGRNTFSLGKKKYHLVPDSTIYVLLIFLEIAGVSKSLHKGMRGKMLKKIQSHYSQIRGTEI
jgi:hypothetical protein